LIAKRLVAILGALALTGGAKPETYTIDLGRYFPTAAAEAQSRVQVARDVRAFVESSPQATAPSVLRWLRRYDALLESLERHDIYVYLRAEEDDRDLADARADEELGSLEQSATNRVVAAAGVFGPGGIRRLTANASLKPYAFLLRRSLTASQHRLNAAEERTVAVAVTPTLDAAAGTYKALRKSPEPIASHDETYATLLATIVTARNGIARLRGFGGAPDASYFDKSLDSASVDAVLRAVRASKASAEYRRAAARAPRSGFTPAPLPVSQAIPTVVDAARPMGAEYSGAYASLLNPAARRLDICSASECDDTGFSVGFAGSESGVFYGKFDGSTNAVRALSHESGHAVHRQYMNAGQPIAAYNQGPSFMFESFAIFNELLLLDHLYRSAGSDGERAYYLDRFLADATFQVYRSAEEVELENAIYRGVVEGSLKTAADFNALTVRVFSQYDSSARNDPDTAGYWARNRLYYTDPLYDVNYLYAGLLALRYFADFERSPDAFSKRYVALLRNGFNDTPATLERRFLGIDLTNASGLVADATQIISERTLLLSRLYEKPRESQPTSR
jgi:oligoendopeptidase F